jgi:hypothetical protein
VLTTLFKLAAVVVFVFMLVAALSSAGTCLGKNVWVWLSCGLLALAVALVLAPWVDEHVAKK